MAYKFKKFKIKWNKKKGKFLKRKVNRQASRKASLRWRRNRGKMMGALRKARRKGKITNRRNKSRGIFRKLKVARKRFKNILRSDVDMSMFVSMILNEENIMNVPEIEIDREVDLDHMSDSLQDIKSFLEDSEEYQEAQREFIEHAMDVIEDLKYLDEDDLTDEEMDQISDILDLIDDYAAICGEYDDGDYGYVHSDLDDDEEYHESNYDEEE
jgi:hypothetical protein